MPGLGAIATVDGRRVGAVPVDVPAAPGDHEVTLSRDAYETALKQAGFGEITTVPAIWSCRPRFHRVCPHHAVHTYS